MIGILLGISLVLALLSISLPIFLVIACIGIGYRLIKGDEISEKWLDEKRNELKEQMEHEQNYAKDILENTKTLHESGEAIETDQLVLDEYAFSKVEENDILKGLQDSYEHKQSNKTVLENMTKDILSGDKRANYLETYLQALEDKIAVTTNKEELERLKQEYTAYAFFIKDLAVQKNKYLKDINLSNEKERQKAYELLNKPEIK